MSYWVNWVAWVEHNRLNRHSKLKKHVKLMSFELQVTGYEFKYIGCRVLGVGSRSIVDRINDLLKQKW